MASLIIYTHGNEKQIFPVRLKREREICIFMPRSYNRGDIRCQKGGEQQPLPERLRAWRSTSNRGPSANLEDKSAPVGANVVIIGGGNLSTREKRRRRWRKRRRRSVKTAWQSGSARSPLASSGLVCPPFARNVGHTLPPLEPASTILFPSAAR